tara:strand:+ start:639 stop:806 length:168 start_codon:yes stop_codon:yes gene_type:complete
MKIDKNKNKKALWIDEELHKQIRIFAIEEGINIESATQRLIPLGMCTHKLEKTND